MTCEGLAAFIDGERDAMLAALGDFIAIPSVSSDLPQVERALDYILALSRSMGFAARREAEGRVGVIECGEGPETLGILAHVDVVPPGDRAGWDSDPFRADIRDGALYGRGAIDDKGPVVAALWAMRAVKDSGEPLRKRVQLILGTQEEVDWTDMEAYVKSCPLPDYGFTPDDAFPICNIEKGCGAVKLRIPLDGADGVYITSLCSGTAFNAVPAAARAELSDGRVITAEGRAVHACQPEKGENALLKLCDTLTGMALAENAALKFCRMLSERFCGVYGEGVGLYSESEYYEGEFVHRNTVTPTHCLTENGVLTASFDVRFPYGEDPARIRAVFEALAGELGGTVAEGDLMPAVFVSRSRPFLHAFAEAYEEATPYTNEYTIAYGGSYAKAMPNVVAWGPLLPGDEDTCHAANECIGLENLATNAKVFAAAIAKIALSEQSFK